MCYLGVIILLIVSDFCNESIFRHQLEFHGHIFFFFSFCNNSSQIFFRLSISLSVNSCSKYPAFELFQFETVIAKCIVELHLIILSISFQFSTILCQVWIPIRCLQIFKVFFIFLFLCLPFLNLLNHIFWCAIREVFAETQFSLFFQSKHAALIYTDKSVQIGVFSNGEMLSNCKTLCWLDLALSDCLNRKYKTKSSFLSKQFNN